MKETQQEINYFKVLNQLELIRNTKRLKFKLNNLFKDIVFKDKNVLEIGGGDGLLSYYACIKGAKNVDMVEPESDGSTIGIQKISKRIGEELNCDNLRLHNNYFQNFKSSNIKYNIIILHNVINHLNEEACINLHKSNGSKEIYKKIFTKLNDISNPKAVLIICDCSRNNFFNDIGLKNPFAPTIEWHKHQSPKTWASLLKESGFELIFIKWPSFNRLYAVGNILSNKLFSYFLNSHFCMRLKKL